MFGISFNRLKYCFAALIGVLPLLSASLQGQVTINEAVSSNSLQLDSDEDSPDWFEIYNAGTDEVSLKDWTITDQLDEPEKWKFPAFTMEADSYLQIWASGKDRSQLGVVRTLLTEGDSYRYFIPTQNVTFPWTAPQFDDSAWAAGAVGIGYGDGDDETIVPNGTRVVFLRTTFNIADAALIEQLILDIDYDDAFVAYLNGVEVTRSNITGNPPAFDAFANIDHEAQLKEGGKPDRFILENIDDLIWSGENVFCIQVHNFLANSSDLSMIPFLSAQYKSETTEGIEPPAILNLSASQLHTNFKLSSEGETLYLFNENGVLQSSLEIPTDLPTNHAFGIPAGGDSPKVFSTGTPGLPNPAIGFTGFITSTVEFSHPGGLCDELVLSLSGAAAGEQIHYTLDASIPTENSPAFVYPLTINADQVIRARIFRSDYIPSRTQSKTYLVNKTHQLPVVTLVTEPDNLFDEANGIYAFGSSFNPNFPYFGANFWEDWERPISFSFYEKDGSLGTSFNAGVKIFGGYSRGNDQRSFSFFARKKYGTGKIDYPFFPNQPYEEFEAITLRNSGNDWLNTNIRDAALTSLMKDSDLEYADNLPVVTYINGEYWGIYHLREKINEHFLASKKDVEAEAVTLLDREGIEIQGSNTAYKELYYFIANNDMSIAENYAAVKEQIDVANFIQYQAAQIYFNNVDWPGNNNKYWKVPGGKWRWILFDTDFSFGPWADTEYANNALAAALATDGPPWPNPPWATLLLRKLTTNLEFRNQFINQFADELNARFLAEDVVLHIEETLARIEAEKVAHFDRWAGSIPWHNERVYNMKKFALNRPFRQKQHIRDQFNLPAFHSLTILNEDTNMGQVRVNSLTIDQVNWAGDYFEQVPIEVEAIPLPGYTFDRWTGGSNSTKATISLDLKKNTSVTPLFKAIETDKIFLTINEINYNSPAEQDAGDWIELYNSSSGVANLSGFVFKDSEADHSFVLPEGTVIAENGYLILAKNLAKFEQIHPAVNNVIGQFDFGLSSEGDAVRIFDPAGKLKDEVNYTAAAPWPSGANGEGPSLELINTALDNAIAANWDTLHPLGSPGEPNVEQIIRPADGEVIYNLTAFPNPFTDQLNLTFSIAQSTHLEAHLYNAIGQLVRTIFQAQLDEGSFQITESFPDLSPGVYLLKLITDQEEAITIKWLKK